MPGSRAGFDRSESSIGDSPGRGFLIQDAGWGWGPASMARPYSSDLRDRVVASVTGGRTCRATARLFGVSVASVVKWSRSEEHTSELQSHSDVVCRLLLV